MLVMLMKGERIRMTGRRRRQEVLLRISVAVFFYSAEMIRVFRLIETVLVGSQIHFLRLFRRKVHFDDGRLGVEGRGKPRRIPSRRRIG